MSGSADSADKQGKVREHPPKGVEMHEEAGQPPGHASPRPGEAQRREIFSVLFAENYAAIVAYAGRRVESRAVAEEIAAETFATAWDKLDPRAPFTRRWLYRTASHKVMNHWSRTRTRRELEQRLVHDANEVLSGADPLEVLALREALLRLPLRQAEALRLTAWEGLSAAEVGEVLGCRVSTVHKILSRGRARLRELLADEPAAPAFQPQTLSGGESFS